MKPKTAVDRLEALLEYRLPQSGKALTTIVLSREDAEELLAVILMLRMQLELRK